MSERLPLATDVQVIDLAGRQQTAATAEISQNLRQAATGSSKITAGIEGVADLAKRPSAGAEQNLHAADRLAEMASRLRKVVTGIQR